MDFQKAVSMHLLVLSAFQQWEPEGNVHVCVNVSMHLLVLSAFQPVCMLSLFSTWGVSMHLLVLSAFQPNKKGVENGLRGMFECTFWCSVLSNLVDPRAATMQDQV